MREFEKFENISYPYIFRKSIPPGEKGCMSIPLTGHGYITQVTVNFALGEDGTLHIRPFVELPGEITQELLRYAGDNYLSGDGTSYKLPCYQEIENHTLLKVSYENTATDPKSADSIIMVDIICQYDGYIEPKNIIE
ncbi:MAG: hypothetical protein ACK5MV_05210 [Aminipila sp.]